MNRGGEKRVKYISESYSCRRCCARFLSNEPQRANTPAASLLTHPLPSSRTIDRRSLAIAAESPPRPRRHEPQPFVSHQVVRPGTALVHWSLAFDPRPMCRLGFRCAPRKCLSVESRLVAAAGIFELRHRALHDACPKARSTSRGHVTRSTPLRHPCRRSQAGTQRPLSIAARPTFRGFHSADFDSPPVFGFTTQPLGAWSSDHHRGAIPADTVRQTFGRPERSP